MKPMPSSRTKLMATPNGLSKLQRRLLAIPKAVKKEVVPALMKSAQDMAGSMRSLAQSSKDTGALIDSIAITGPLQHTPPYSQPGGSTFVSENSVAITVGNSGVRYGHLVEYGTASAPAQPFFWPAVRLGRKKAANRIKRAISKAVKTAK
jgi:HK97 gp10 family phage protein